jgi:UDP-N-acetylglucosamine 2-epimerase (non-hydrolysing)
MNAKQKIVLVVGTRPNFIKVTRFKSVAFELYPSLELIIVHTGQHFDEKLADVFFRQLNLTPDHFLNIGSGSQASQIGRIIIEFEKYLLESKPDIVMVVGDVNSTIAAAICANKCGIKVAHLESGLRSNDLEMPEEINRILTDKLSSLFFVTEKSGIENLKREGIIENVYLVGNSMIDTMVAFEEQINSANIENLNLNPSKKVVLITMHRPSNVDTNEGLRKMVTLITQLSKKYQVVFPVHPRTLKNLKAFGLNEDFASSGVCFCEPLDYFTFQKLISISQLVITDSGGVQEETTFKGIPCLTLRANTERPVTIEKGTNKLLPFEVDKVLAAVNQIESGEFKKGEIPEFWDGKTTERVLKILSNKI